MSGPSELQNNVGCDWFETIRLAAGTYSFATHMPAPCDSALCIGRPVTLEAAVPGAVVTLDGGGALRVMSITGGTVESPVELVGLTITGGSASEASARISNLLDPSSAPLECYTFATQGGGVFVDANAFAYFTNCTIIGNLAHSYVVLAF